MEISLLKLRDGQQLPDIVSRMPLRRSVLSRVLHIRKEREKRGGRLQIGAELYSQIVRARSRRYDVAERKRRHGAFDEFVRQALPERTDTH